MNTVYTSPLMDKLDRYIRVNVTEEEHQAVQDEAARDGRSLSWVARRRMLKGGLMLDRRKAKS
jgi:hypothetical protein